MKADSTFTLWAAKSWLRQLQGLSDCNFLPAEKSHTNFVGVEALNLNAVHR